MLPGRSNIFIGPSGVGFGDERGADARPERSVHVHVHGQHGSAAVQRLRGEPWRGVAVREFERGTGAGAALAVDHVGGADAGGGVGGAAGAAGGGASWGACGCLPPNRPPNIGDIIGAIADIKGIAAAIF